MINIKTFTDYIEKINITYEVDEEYKPEVIEYFEIYYNYLSRNIDYNKVKKELGISYKEIDNYLYYISYILSHKYNCDIPCQNDELNIIFKKDLKILNKLEIICLECMEYKLSKISYLDMVSYIIETNPVIIDNYIDTFDLKIDDLEDNLNDFDIKIDIYKLEKSINNIVYDFEYSEKSIYKEIDIEDNNDENRCDCKIIDIIKDIFCN